MTLQEIRRRNPQLAIIVEEMCRLVAADAEGIDFHNEDDPYYEKYEWDKDQETEFYDWMTKFLYNTPSARKELGVRGKSKKACKYTPGIFTMFYGWRTKKEDSLDSTNIITDKL